MTIHLYFIYFIFRITRLILSANIFSERIGAYLAEKWRYNYHPLIIKGEDKPNQSVVERSTIRVLKVVYAGERRGVKCSLTDLNGLQTQDYHCLSYTWECPFEPDVDYVIQYRSTFAIRLEPLLSIIRKAWKKFGRFLQPEQYTISVDGGFLTVTPNLWHALIHLNQTRPDELQAIWIDAICINQDNKDEKTSQVGIMHHIYRTAKSVVVWLGPEDTRNENPAVVSEVIDALHKQEEARPGFCKNMLEMVWKEDFEEFPAPDSMRSLGFEHWFYVRNFLQRAYFQRMWIFQEVILAQKIIVTCGKRVMNWEDVRDISQAFSSFGTDIMTRYSRPGSWAGECNGPHRTAFWRDQYRAKPEGEGLRKQFGPFVLVLNRNAYKCGNRRDVLYAHIGVCNYDRIVPDYKKPVAQVYTEFWIDVLERVPTSLDFLTCVEDSSGSVNCRKLTALKKVTEEMDLPSWVPDFKAKCEPESLTQHYYTDCFSASAGIQETRHSICHINYHLALHGFIFDTIAETTESGAELQQHNSTVRILSLMILLLFKHGENYPTNEHPFEAVWKTMAILTDIKGERDTDYPPPLSARESFRNWLLYILTLPRALPTTRNAQNESQDPLVNILHSLDTSKLVPSLWDVKLEAEAHRLFLHARVEHGRARLKTPAGPAAKIQSRSDEDLALTFKATNKGHLGMAASSFGDVALKKMRLFLTQEESFIGKGPQSMRVGDKVVLVSGARVPFILRRVEAEGVERWGFVGQAYMYGVMHGEVAGKWEGREAREFVVE
jgi:hypothetical protein